jgi:RNA polymerase sigma-B factor
VDELRLEVRRVETTDVVLARGELDAAVAPLLSATLDELVSAGAVEIVVDLSEVTLLDCTVLGVLTGCRDRFPALRAAGAAGTVLELMEITGVAKRLRAYDAPPALPPDATLPESALATVERLLTEARRLPGDSAERARIRTRAVELALPFAEQLARRFRNRGQGLDDLTQVAYLGLLKAVDGYDPDLGHRFVSYAIPTVLGELRRYFRDRTWGVRVPRRLQDLRSEISQGTDELTQRLGRSPTIGELAVHLDTDEEEIIEAEVASRGYRPVSLFHPIGDGDDGELVDLIGGPDPALELVDTQASLPSVLSRLPTREQQIISMRFFGNCTQTQIAEQLGISQMHVSRLLARALAALRQDLLAEE